MDKNKLAKAEQKAFKWLKDKGYDRKLCKDVAPILAIYELEQLTIPVVGRTNLIDKHPIEGVNCFMQKEIEDEDDELVCRSCKTGIDEDEGRFGYCWNCYEN